MTTLDQQPVTSSQPRRIPFSLDEATAAAYEFLRDGDASEDFIRYYFGGFTMNLEKGLATLRNTIYMKLNNKGTDVSTFLHQPTVTQALERFGTTPSDKFPLFVSCDPEDISLPRYIEFYSLKYRPAPIVFLGNHKARRNFLYSTASSLREITKAKKPDEFQIVSIVPGNMVNETTRYLQVANKRDVAYYFDDDAAGNEAIMVYLEGLGNKRPKREAPTHSVILFYDDGKHPDYLKRIIKVAEKRDNGVHIIIITSPDSYDAVPDGSMVYAGGGCESILGSFAGYDKRPILHSQSILVTDPELPRYWMFDAK